MHDKDTLKSDVENQNYSFSACASAAKTNKPIIFLLSVVLSPFYSKSYTSVIQNKEISSRSGHYQVVVSQWSSHKKSGIDIIEIKTYVQTTCLFTQRFLNNFFWNFLKVEIISIPFTYILEKINKNYDRK